MKKLFLLLLLSVTLFSCSERGTITDEPKDFIVIHGKTYKLMSVVPCKGCHDIWIMYPKDSLDAQPQVINWTEQSGKTSHNRTLVKVD